MINFSENSVFNLDPIDMSKIVNGLEILLIDGEEIVGAFKTVRDQVIFTNKRIIAIDIQGITGLKKDITSLPYSRIQYYSIETPGFAEILPDSVVTLRFNDGFEAKFEFRGKSNIMEVGRCISEYVLARH